MMKLLYVILLSFYFFACSSSKEDIAGNSAETGSPELAGVFILDNGKKAAYAHVKCVPHDFNALKDELPKEFETLADEFGLYSFDSIPSGIYSIEAFHEESKKIFLKQNVNIIENESIVIEDTLKEPGKAKLLIPLKFEENSKGIITVKGTTILSDVIVQNGSVYVENLPENSLDLLLFINNDSLLFKKTTIKSQETTIIGDTLELEFKVPLALPTNVDSFPEVSTDIPIVIHLNSQICNIELIKKLKGRLEAYRMSNNKNLSKTLPILKSSFESENEILVWVRLDSLNVQDTIKFVLNTSKEESFAKDMFPTSRMYTAVLLFDNKDQPIKDYAELNYYNGQSTNTKLVDGIIGNALNFNSESHVIINNTAQENSSKFSDFNRTFEDHFGISLWINLSNVDSSQTIFSKGDFQYNLKFRPDSGFVFSFYKLSESKLKDSSEIFTTDTIFYRYYLTSGKDIIKANSWNYLAINYNGASANMYINDSEVSNSFKQELCEYSKVENSDFYFGGFSGSIDEFMFAESFRTKSWVLATYLNQASVWPITKK